ncbi:hypothetical protein [Flavobacterium sp. B17]|nr:hypothetical protein [Flavobacterium sp. B17]
MSFNVENSIIASGGSAWEALTKAPGVQVNSILVFPVLGSMKVMGSRVKI